LDQVNLREVGHRKVSTYSGGMLRRFGIALALLGRPRLLIVDEPTAGLDPVVRAEVLDVLWEILEDGDKSILYSTHVLSDISRLADEIVFLREGQIVRRDAKDALTDTWRRLSFRFAGDLPPLGSERRHRRAGDEHQLVTPDGEASLAMLRELGAERVQEARMTIDEIAVEILREGHHVGSD
ncbi:MAG: AAA family ATPase, partial [Acidobacteriota bacterium]